MGLLVGPTVLNVFHFKPLKQSALLEVLTEVAGLISQFSAGVKMLHRSASIDGAPVLLATVSMTASIAMVAAFSTTCLGCRWAHAYCCIVAPTDPVQATDVQIRHLGHQDELRFTLTCEAGMNDGSAFTFVMLGSGACQFPTDEHDTFD